MALAMPKDTPSDARMIVIPKSYTRRKCTHHVYVPKNTRRAACLSKISGARTTKVCPIAVSLPPIPILPLLNLPRLGS